jgi:hypothetical protein
MCKSYPTCSLERFGSEFVNLVIENPDISVEYYSKCILNICILLVVQYNILDSTSDFGVQVPLLLGVELVTTLAELKTTGIPLSNK